MKNLSQELNEVRTLLIEKGIKTVSFDIDGTLYPMSEAKLMWWKCFFISPLRSLKFISIRKNWEKRRAGKEKVAITQTDVNFFEEFLLSLYHKNMVAPEVISLINELPEKGINVFFLSDHSATTKLACLSLVDAGKPIDCLRETNELKPHAEISRLLTERYQINPLTHLHLGDRWTDEEQARLFGCHFLYLAP